MSVRDFLVEIGTEELPPKSLLALSEALTQGIAAGLAAQSLRHGKVESFAAPRRLAVLVRKLAEQQPDQELKRRGPPVTAAFAADGTPTRAALAFAESCGTSIEALGRVTEPKGEFLHYTGVKPGAHTCDLIAGIVTAALGGLPIAKRMRWGSGTAEFVRPVHWIVLLYGADVIPARILDVDAGRVTFGHRFMAPKAISLATPSAYARRLEQSGKVIANFADRRARIRAGVEALAAAEGVTALISDSLLDEVTALVEWPVPLVGRFEDRFLSLPEEVLIATLQDHQRYFPVRTAAGQLSPMFITVANVESRNLAAVRAGNERVVRPRLSDAAFFWDSDRRHTLASRCEALKAVTFQAQLGSYHQKSARVATLGAELASVTGADPAEVRRAAAIAKCDLLTGLVGEFTELQGIMGAYYARLDGETAAVAAAMAEQYQPRFAGDALPVGAVGTALALADKLDTIVGIFAIGQRPSGTRDPFGLRRAAVGFLRIVLERRLELDLPALIKCAFTSAEADIASVSATRTAAPGGAATGGNPAEVYDYVMERLRAHYVESEQGITVEMFDAVLERRPVSPLDFDRRLAALHAFLQLEAAPALAAANKRIANILKKAAVAIGVVDPSRFVEAEEAALAAAVQAIRPEVGALIAERDYTAALQRLATLRPPVDAFFDRVMVMHEDAAVRSNRLNLLGAVRALFLEIADLSRLPG